MIDVPGTNFVSHVISFSFFKCLFQPVLQWGYINLLLFKYQAIRLTNLTAPFLLSNCVLPQVSSNQTTRTRKLFPMKCCYSVDKWMILGINFPSRYIRWLIVTISSRDATDTCLRNDHKAKQKNPNTTPPQKNHEIWHPCSSNGKTPPIPKLPCALGICVSL